MGMKRFTSVPFLMKIVELLLGCLCVGLIAQEICATTTWKTEVVHATYFGFVMTTTLVILSYIINTPIHGYMMIAVDFCAGLLYITAAAMNLQVYDKSTSKNGKLIGAGVVGLCNGIAFLINCFLSWRFSDLD